MKTEACDTACAAGIKVCDTDPKKAEGDKLSSCMTGYFVSANACKKCKDDFTLECKDEKEATKCVVGYYLDAKKKECAKCTNANTATCKELGSLSCLPGFFLAASSCVSACATSGHTCASATSDLTCADGFAFNGTTKIVC